MKLLIVSGTHGNEINPIWAVNKFRNLRNSNSYNENLKFIIGNPKACEKGVRYIDVDLNRSFNTNKMNINNKCYELDRSEFLLNKYGNESSGGCQIAIDLHTTTSCMGTSIVMYGRREKDFCLAALLQHKFGLPIYLHEKDNNQNGFLVEAWPCGLVIEIGPVAQNHYDPVVVEKFYIILEFLDNIIKKIEYKKFRFPEEFTVFVHQKSIDYPRDKDSNIIGLIHPLRINKDWLGIKKGDPLFTKISGETIVYEEEDITYPVFIGEAAYKEKQIAMSFTNKENIRFSERWINNFFNF